MTLTNEQTGETFIEKPSLTAFIFFAVRENADGTVGSDNAVGGLPAEIVFLKETHVQELEEITSHPEFAEANRLLAEYKEKYGPLERCDHPDSAREGEAGCGLCGAVMN
jgi:hypothetical protein